MHSLKLTTPSDREIELTRTFDAPRSLVFAAMTKPELLKRWLFGPNGWSLVVCEIDLTVGGALRYLWRHTSGTEMGMSGVYREIVIPERIVSTEKFDDAWYPGEAVGTLLFLEEGGRTTMINTILYESSAARDAVLETGMEQGLALGYNRLEEVLQSLEVA